jgi:hypothetical protein
MIYRGSPSKHLPALASTIARKLAENRRCLYLNTPAMVAGIRTYLFADGVDVSRETSKGALVLSAEQHLNDGCFDADQMLAMLSSAVDDALRAGYTGLWATGDMTWEFGHERNLAKLREYEIGLEELFQRQPALEGMCQYHIDTMPPDAVLDGLKSHRACYINQTLSVLNPYFAGADGSRVDMRPIGWRNLLATPFSVDEGLAG